MAEEANDAVLGVMREAGRANPYLIREETGFEKGTVNTALVTLMRRGTVQQVTRGLYEYTGETEDKPMTIAIKLEDEWITTEDIAEKSLDELRDLRRDVIDGMDNMEPSGGRQEFDVGAGHALVLSRVNAEIAMREEDG